MPSPPSKLTFFPPFSSCHSTVKTTMSTTTTSPSEPEGPLAARLASLMAGSQPDTTTSEPSTWEQKQLRRILNHHRELLTRYRSGNPSPESCPGLPSLKGIHPLGVYRRFAGLVEQVLISEIESLEREIEIERMLMHMPGVRVGGPPNVGTTTEVVNSGREFVSGRNCASITAGEEEAARVERDKKAKLHLANELPGGIIVGPSNDDSQAGRNENSAAGNDGYVAAIFQNLRMVGGESLNRTSGVANMVEQPHTLPGSRSLGAIGDELGQGQRPNFIQISKPSSNTNNDGEEEAKCKEAVSERGAGYGDVCQVREAPDWSNAGFQGRRIRDGTDEWRALFRLFPRATSLDEGENASPETAMDAGPTPWTVTKVRPTTSTTPESELVAEPDSEPTSEPETPEKIVLQKIAYLEAEIAKICSSEASSRHTSSDSTNTNASSALTTTRQTTPLEAAVYWDTPTGLPQFGNAKPVQIERLSADAPVFTPAAQPTRHVHSLPPATTEDSEGTVTFPDGVVYIIPSSHDEEARSDEPATNKSPPKSPRTAAFVKAAERQWWQAQNAHNARIRSEKYSVLDSIKENATMLDPMPQRNTIENLRKVDEKLKQDHQQKPDDRGHVIVRAPTHPGRGRGGRGRGRGRGGLAMSTRGPIEAGSSPPPPSGTHNPQNAPRAPRAPRSMMQSSRGGGGHACEPRVPLANKTTNAPVLGGRGGGFQYRGKQRFGTSHRLFGQEEEIWYDAKKKKLVVGSEIAQGSE